MLTVQRGLRPRDPLPRPLEVLAAGGDGLLRAPEPLLGISLLNQTTSTGIDRAVVHTVSAGGPADRAGIKTGDVITAVDGQRTAGADAVIAAIRSHQPGQRVTVTVDPRLLARFDKTANGWRIAPGRYRVLAGTHAGNLPLSAEVALAEAELPP